MSRRYALLDVFASTPLEGNQLAVVLDGDGLDAARMQAISAEFNLAETVFVLAPQAANHRARIRIFTPTHELPFAGHPTVGTAVLLALLDQEGRGDPTDAMLVLEEEVGAVRCVAAPRGERTGHAIFDLPRLPRPADFTLDTERVATAFGLSAAEIGFENHEVSAFDAGVPYAFVPVRDLGVMARLRPYEPYWSAAFPKQVAAYLYTRDTVDAGRQFHARMFWHGKGFVEDPATGSAVAAFAGVIQAFDRPTLGTHHHRIEQGFEMGRPSVIQLECDVEGQGLHAARIGGDAVIVGRGTLYA